MLFGVIGGDRRQAELLKLLRQDGYQAAAYGTAGETDWERAVSAEVVLLPLPLCREGDTINIDIPNASITLEVSDEVLAQRKAKYVAPEPNIKTGWLSRYARMVTSANLGAVLK